MVALQGLHMIDAFRCSTLSASVGQMSFCLWCLKLGGVLKQSWSMLERSITGWWLCAMFVGLFLAWLHNTFWITIPDAKPSMTGNVWNRRDRKRQRNCSRSPSPREERGHPNHPTQRSLKDQKSGMPLTTSCLVQLENISQCPFWIFLASFLGCVLAQSDKWSFLFFQLQCVRCNGAYVNHSILCSNFNRLKWKTFNKSLMFIQSFVSCVKLHSWAGDLNSSTPQHWRGHLEPSPPCFHWRFQVSFQCRIFLPVQHGNLGRGPLHGGCQEFSRHQCLWMK